MITQFQPLVKHDRKSHKKLIPASRIITGLQLKKPNTTISSHSSIHQSLQHSSLKTIINASSLKKSSTIISQNSNHTSSKILPTLSKPQKLSSQHTFIHSQFSNKLQLSKSHAKNKQQGCQVQIIQQGSKQKNVQNLLKKYLHTNFIQTLVGFINKQWEQQQETLMKQKRFQALKNLVVHKMNVNNALIDDFMLMQYPKYSQHQQKMMISLLFKLTSQSLKQFQCILLQLLNKIPQDTILKQQASLQFLYQTLLQMYNPKSASNLDKWKQQISLHSQAYSIQKNALKCQIITKLKPSLNFVQQIQKYLIQFQRQLTKINNNIQVLQMERTKIHDLLKKKNQIQFVVIDYKKVKDIKNQNNQILLQQFNQQFIKVHEMQHLKNKNIIKSLNKQLQQLKSKLQQQQLLTKSLQSQIATLQLSIPQKQDASIQVHLFSHPQKTTTNTSRLSLLDCFLTNVQTPFSFNKTITSALINIICTDKILHDYQIVKNKYLFQPFNQYLISWFLIKCGDKNIAKIFTKNFIYGIQQLKNQHKRFQIFWKICGGGRGSSIKKSVGQDLQCVYFQTYKAWYYLIKISMLYRQKLSEQSSGYHLFPPLLCQNLFKIPLRKVYDFISQFLQQQGIQLPSDLNNLIDYYAINEISRYKANDYQFQHNQLQQIHILKQINFDIIAGFILEFIAKNQCNNLQQLLTVITIKQKQSGNVLGYSEFQSVFKKFYKFKRSKIQSIFTNMAIIDQRNMMDIQNVQPLIRAIIEDESGIRSMFDEIQSLKSLILSQKSNLKGDKLIISINSYQNFKQRFYLQFYDFYDTTLFLQQIYKQIKPLLKKKLKYLTDTQSQLSTLVNIKSTSKVQVIDIQQSNNNQSQSQQNYSQQQQQSKVKQLNRTKYRNQLENKIDQWGKIIVRIPHFGQKILTVEQSLVHSMRRKQMIQATQFAWRTLRDILILVSKQ